MPGRILTVLLLAMGALCCPFRCLHHQADSVAFLAENVTNDQHVSRPSPPAEQNESGCICRGACFVEAPTLTPIDQLPWSPLAQVCVPLLEISEQALLGAFNAPADHQGLPLAGKTLCTWHASFLF